MLMVLSGTRNSQKQREVYPMVEPTIVCPSCKNEVKLTESLAAPLLEDVRRQFESKLAAKEADVSKREAAIRAEKESLAEAQTKIEEQVAEQVKAERVKIAAAEAKKARALLAQELETKSKEVEDLQDLLKNRDEKLAAKEADVSKREAVIRAEKESLAEAQAKIEQRVAERVEADREKIVAAEAKKARALLAQELETKSKTVEDLQELLKNRDEKLAAKETEIAKREASIRAEKDSLAEAQSKLEEQVAEQLKTERAKIVAAEGKKARALLDQELETKAKEVDDLQQLLKNRDEKLADAQQAQADLVRKQRELDDAKRAMDLTIETRIQEALQSVRDAARTEAEDSMRLRVAEKEHTIAGMQKQIEELKRKAEQGSQQLQGEVQELEIESVLRSHFLHDIIEAVPKGTHGGDVLHQVTGTLSSACGTILWESKRTKNWSDGWLAKLREDQRTAKADLAVIVSQALPKEIRSFGFIDGIWIANPQSVVALATVLRFALIEIAAVRQASQGQQTKMELVYQYLTGPVFRHRIQAIVEKISDMRTDLEKERATMTKLWSKREKQINCVIESTAGVFGDFQGIAGKPLQEIEGLEIKLLEVEPAA